MNGLVSKSEDKISNLKNNDCITKQIGKSILINQIIKANNCFDRKLLIEVVKMLNIHYKTGAILFVDERMKKMSGQNVQPKIINIDYLFCNKRLSKKDFVLTAIEYSLNMYVTDKQCGYSLFKNIDTGMIFSIGKSGINDTFSSHKNRDLLKYNTANVLDKIVQEGVYFITTSTPDDVNNIKYHHFFTLARIFNNNENVLIHSVIREFPNDKTKENSFYYHRIEYLYNSKKEAAQGAPT